MNKPWTSNPASCKSSAETAESTPPDMPTITMPASSGAGRGCMRRLYRRRRTCAGLSPRSEGEFALHEHLAHLGFLHAGLPYLIEEIEVAADHARIVHVRNDIPAICLQPVDQGAVVRNDEGAGARRELWAHRTHVDAAGQAASQGQKAVVVHHCARRVREQHADFGIRTGQYQPFDGLEKGLLAVDQRFQIMRENRQ